MHRISSIEKMNFVVLFLLIIPTIAASQNSEAKIRSLNDHLDSLFTQESGITTAEFENVENQILDLYNKIYSDSISIHNFESDIKNLIAELNGADTDIKLLQTKLNSLKQNPVSLLPHFIN